MHGGATERQRRRTWAGRDGVVVNKAMFGGVWCCALRRVASERLRASLASDAADCSCPSLPLGHNRVRYSSLPLLFSLFPPTPCMLLLRHSAHRVFLGPPHTISSDSLDTSTVLRLRGLICPYRFVPHLVHISLISISPSSQAEDLESTFRCDQRTSCPPSFFLLSDHDHPATFLISFRGAP